MTLTARFDRASFKGDAVVTTEGYIRANSVVTRCGVFTYQNADGSIRKELRHPDDVWNEDSINSMFMIPVTNEHPTDRLVNSFNFKRLSIGYTGEAVKKDGDYVLSNFVINDAEGVEAVTKQGKKQLSLGYTVDLIDEAGEYEGERYDARQTNIRYNHLALVAKARAGEQATIALDRLDAFEIETEKEVDIMAKRKIKIDAEEVWLEPETASYVERMQDDLRNLTDEKERVSRELADKEAELKRVNGEIEQIRMKMESTEAERDSMADMSKRAQDVVLSHDSAEFKRAVSKRIELLDVAKKKLDADSVSKLDSLDDLSIKKQVIAKARKSISLDGKSNHYIDALFDTIVDEIKTSVNVDSVQYSKSNFDGLECDAEKARQDMMRKQKEKSERKGS